MTFTVAPLGTDTKFTPGKEENAYDKAETLSYVATLIASDDKPEKVDDVVAYKNSQVIVVDGPTTLGTEVGDRIARSVLAILDALSRGEKNISIMAHSRGAVEAILVAHELERIMRLFASEQEKDIQKSVCPYTLKAMNNSPHKEAFSKLNLEAIKSNIQDLKISIFNIDPVPGGNYMVFTKPTTLAWTDPRMYEIPAIVKKYHQYSYRNERTRCFRGIIPKPVSKETEVRLESSPGHHGTGSGNLKDQQRHDLPPELKGLSTEHVQQLMVLKLIHFLRDTDVKLDFSNVENGPFAQILVPLKDVLQDDFLFNETIARLYHEQYELIVQNIQAYNHFNKTSYAVLGQEQYFQSFLWNVLDHRIVRHDSGQKGYLPSIIPTPAGDKFLNYEHARLYLNQQLGLKEQMSLKEKIIRSTSRLIKVCSHVKKLKDLEQEKKSKPKASTVEPSLMSTSLVQDKMAHSVNANSAEGFNLILEGLSLLIDEVRRPFLMDLPSENGLFEVVVDSLAKFKSPEMEGNELAKKILDKLNQDLEQTLLMKREALLKGSDVLRSYLKDIEFFDTMIKDITLALRGLTTSHPGKDSDSYLLSEYLLVIIQDSEELKGSSLSQKKEWIGAQQRLLTERGSEFTSKQAQEIGNLVLNTMSEALEDSENYTLPLVMQELLQVNAQLSQYRNSLDDFKILYSKLPYDNWAQEAQEKQNNLIALAAEYIVREQLDLENDIKPIFIGDLDLFKKIANAAYGLGIPHPLTLKLEESNLRLVDLEKQLEIDKAEHNRQAESLTKELALARERLIKLDGDLMNERQIHVAEQEKISLEVKNLTLQLEEQRRGRTQDNQELTRILKQEKQRHTEEIDKLNTDLELEKTSHSQDRDADAHQLQQEKESRKQEVEKLVLQIETLRLELEAEKQDRAQDQISTEELMQQTKEKHLQAVKDLTFKIQELTSRLESEQQSRKQDNELRESEFRQSQESHKLQLDDLDKSTKELVRKHQEHASSQQKLLDQLGSELEQVKKSLNEKSEELDREAKENVRVRKELNDEITALNDRLNREKSLRETELEQLLGDQKELNSKLQTDKEIRAHIHISDQLIPLTKEYLAYLHKKAKKWDAGIDIETLESFGNEEENQQYQLLRNKYLITRNLLNILEDSEKNPLPSERVLKFTAQLVEDEKQLIAHRDTMWKQYTLNCLVGLSVVMTGFIPGLLVLLVASSYYKKSDILFFTKTGGEEYFDRVQNTGLELNR